MLYGSEIDKKIEQRMNVSEMRIFRLIIGVIRENRRRNEYVR